jgi:methionyl aminopeptidase
VNEEVVHGIPNDPENPKILKGGDIVTLDLGVTYKNLITDHAITMPVGIVNPKGMKLIRATEEALRRGIEALKLGGKIGDFGAEVMRVADKYGLNIAEDLSGHGVGYNVHEEPYVPNMAYKGEGPTLKEGLVIALEPMLCEGKGHVRCLKDGYTYVTKDGSRSAHFEHTIAVTNKGIEILTKV